jgi:hypothetical protein
MGAYGGAYSGLGCDCFLYVGAIGCAYSVLGTSYWSDR